MKHDKVKEKPRAKKKPYVEPTIIEFGKVGQLTQAGTAGMSEAGGGGMMGGGVPTRML